MGVDLNLNEFFEKLGISKGTLKFLFWALVLCFLFAFGLWGATSIKTLTAPNIIIKNDTIRQITIKDTCINRDKIIASKRETIDSLEHRINKLSYKIDSVLQDRNRNYTKNPPPP